MTRKIDDRNNPDQAAAMRVKGQVLIKRVERKASQNMPKNTAGKADRVYLKGHGFIAIS